MDDESVLYGLCPAGVPTVQKVRQAVAYGQNSSTHTQLGRELGQDERILYPESDGWMTQHSGAWPYNRQGTDDDAF